MVYTGDYWDAIPLLKELIYNISFNSLGTMFQILGPKQAIFLDP